MSKEPCAVSWAWRRLLIRMSRLGVWFSRLEEVIISGVRYLDEGSRGAGEGSRNYVVFDDKLVDIARKYGLLPLGVGGFDFSQQEQK